MANIKMLAQDYISTEFLSHDLYSLLSREYGPSFFLLNQEKLLSNFHSFSGSFLSYYPKVEVGYSYKTNYTPRICKLLHDVGAWAEVVSEMEFKAAQRNGISPERIIYNGPYKSEDSFREAAFGGSIINLDSQRDLNLLASASSFASPQVQIKVALRVNFSVSENVSRFGFDVEDPGFKHVLLFIKSLPNVHLAGLHCHFPDRDLDSFRIRAENLISLCRLLFSDHPPDLLNIGGGFFSELPESLRASMTINPVEFHEYARVIGSILSEAFPSVESCPTLYLEPGTALVANVLTFYTQVLSTKSVRNKNFATVAGSIFDISPNAKVKNLPVKLILDPRLTRKASRGFSIVGFTCIEGDVLTENLDASLEPGDVLAYGNVGSYSIVMRPPFILPSSPMLTFNSGKNSFELIKIKQADSSVFDLFLE